MIYLITALEGIITFISPCLLPMLPIYLSYLAGSSAKNKKNTTLINALGFILGFTVMFMILGAFAGSIGMILSRFQTGVNIVCGLIVIIFGLSFMDVFHLNIFKGMGSHDHLTQNMNFFTSILFGFIFSIGWTPCVGAFLGSALMLASQQGSILKGCILLLCYALGLGIPFFLSALLIEQLKDAFGWIKRHYSIIQKVSGIFLIIIGILMITGFMNRLLTMLA